MHLGYAGFGISGLRAYSNFWTFGLLPGPLQGFMVPSVITSLKKPKKTKVITRHPSLISPQNIFPKAKKGINK